MESLAGCREEVSGSKQLGRWRITVKEGLRKTRAAVFSKQRCRVRLMVLL